MAVVNSDFLSGLLTNFRTIFNGDFAAATLNQKWPMIAMKVDSNTETESYNWFGTVPRMEDVSHSGGPTLQGLARYNMTITNRLFKAGLEVQRTVLEDDKLGLIQPRLRQLGPEAARHPGELLFELFEDNGEAYDGTAFFSNARVDGDSGTIDNIIAGTGTTVAQIQADIASAGAQMAAFKDDRGRIMGLRPNVLVVPPAMVQPMFQALNANQGSINQPVVPAPGDGGLSFTSAGYTVVENPYLTSANDWYALHVSGSVKPFIFQERIAPSLEGITDPNTDSGIFRDKFIYTVRARYEVGYGEPRHGVKVDNA